MIELKLRELREDHDLTQAELTAMLKVHQTTYSDYERGNLNVPLSALDQLANFYHVSVDFLLGRTGVREPYPPK